jgi:tyrosinase
MSLPKDAELLGATSGELPVTGAGAHAWVALDGERPRQLLARLADPAVETSPERVYLALENIRGTHDAVVLSVFLNLPEGALPGEHRERLAGSAALYGLRRASLARGGSSGEGLSEILDLTGRIGELVAADALDPANIRVSIVPNHLLPQGVEITIGRVVIFTLPPG